MSDTALMQVALQMMLTGAKLCAPILLTALFVGFAVSMLQALTQVQDQTLSFVPKILAVGVALLVSGNWMVQTLVSFTTETFALLPTFLGKG
jgi:flagellar biosynthetic protein FliQ